MFGGGGREGGGADIRGEDDELLGRPGHRDIAVDRPFDARTELSGSTRTTRSNSSPFDSSGVSDLTRDVARNGTATARADDAGGPVGMRGEPGVQDRAQLQGGSVDDGMPLLRMDVGTLASGITALMTGSASAMTSSGVR